MRIARSLVNLLLLQLLKGSEPNYRKIDLTVLKVVSELMQGLGISNIELIKEPCFLDSMYLLAKSIIETPYGHPLKFSWPLVVSISVTDKCSFNCNYCYSDSVRYPDNPKTISLELIKKLIRTPIPHFLITGGEPMEYENIPQVINEILGAHKNLNLATNASLKKIEPLIQTYPGQLTVLVSVWGNEAVHDSLRGSGSFDRTIKRINYLSSVPAYCSLNCLISDPAMTCLDALEHIINPNNIYRIFITRAIETGRFPKSSIVWTDELVEELIVKCMYFEKRLGKKLFIAIPEVARFSKSSNWRKLYLRLIGLRLPETCGSGFWTMHVDASGECYPCFACETKHSYGSLLNNSIEQIWQAIQRQTEGRIIGICSAEKTECMTL